MKNALECSAVLLIANAQVLIASSEEGLEYLRRKLMEAITK